MSTKPAVASGVGSGPSSLDSMESLYLSQLDYIERVVDHICRSHRFYGDIAADFGSWVHLRLVEDDYVILRKFRRKSQLRTYLTTVLFNLFRDYRTQRWGKWRPSAAASRMGPAAVQLETLVSRDGLSFDEAVEIVMESVTGVSREELEGFAAELPVRVRRRLEPLDPTVHRLATPPDAEQRLLDRELEEQQGKAQRVLARVLAELGGQERLLLRLRFQEGLTVTEIARMLGVQRRSLYARFERCMCRMRQGMEAGGVSRETISRLLERPGASWVVRFDGNPGEASV